MKNLVNSHRQSQERISKLFLPIANIISVLEYVGKVFRIDGIKTGVRRAIWRQRLAQLGAYSDIAVGVIIKHPDKLSVGVRSGVGANSFIDAGGVIEIGNYVMISHLVSINSQTHPTVPPYHSVIREKTKICDHAWIGASSVILEGVEIGEGAIVAAGAVVTKSVAPYTIVAGVPARKIRDVEKHQ